MQDKPDLDLEDGPPLPEGHPSPGVFVVESSKTVLANRSSFDTAAFEIAVQELQTELREFISDHVSKFLSLQASLSPSNPGEPHELFFSPLSVKSEHFFQIMYTQPLAWRQRYLINRPTSPYPVHKSLLVELWEIIRNTFMIFYAPICSASACSRLPFPVNNWAVLT